MKLLKKTEPRNRSAAGNQHIPYQPPKQPLLGMFREKAADLNAPQLQLQGNKELYVEECKAVLSYDDNLVKFALKGLTLTVLGAGLKVSDFTASTFTIRGDIRGLEIEPQATHSEKVGKGKK